MAGNLYDDALESLDEQPDGASVVTATPAAKDPLYDDAVAVLKENDSAGETMMRRAVRNATSTTPDRAAESRRLALRFGVPAPVIDRNFDDYAKQDQVDLPYAAMQQQTPHMASWLQEGDNAAIAKDDLSSLGALEWLTTAPQRAFQQGMDQFRGDQLRYQSMFRTLTQDERDLLDSYRYHAKSGGALGSDVSWFRRAVVGGIEQLPLLAGVTLMGAKYGVAGAASTATVGAAMGAPAGGVGAIPGAAAGWGIGLAGGTAYGTFRAMGELAAGQAYERYTALRDETGQPLDPDVAKAAALGTGVLNGLLGFVGIEKLVEKIPGIDKLTGGMTRSAVEQALKVPTVRAALANAVKSYAGSLGTQATVAVGMEAANILGGEIAKTASGQPFAPVKASDVFADLVHQGVGALQDFALLSAVGPALGFARDVHEASTARHNAEYFSSLGDAARQSKTVERAPDAVRELLERATEQGPVPAVYAPTEFWTTYWQSKGVDPAEMARKVTGEPDALERATAAGTDLKIPTARYATTIAPTEHNAKFAPELRLAPDEMNAREAEDFLKKAQTAPAAEEQPPTARDQVRQQILEKLVAAQVPRETAEHYARLVESGVGTMAESAGLDPFEVFQRYGVDVTREGVPTEEGPAAGAGGPVDEAGRALGGFAGPDRRSEQNGPPEGVQERRLLPNQQVRLDLQNPELRKAAAQLEARAREAHGKKNERPRGGYAGAIAGAVDNGQTPEQNPDGYLNVANKARSAAPAAEGSQLPDGSREQPHADQGGSGEGQGDGDRAQPRQLPTWRLADIGAGTEDAFQRRPLAENQARLTPEVRRELAHMLDELGAQPYEPRNWHWLEGGPKTGNGAGGAADITAGHAEGELYKDIRGFAPLNKNNKGELADKVRGSGNKVANAVSDLLETGDVKNNLAEGALRVAENRAADDWTDLSPLMLPRPWAEGVSREFTDNLSEAIDNAVAAETDETGLEGADTSFDVSEFGQGLFDTLNDAILEPDAAAKADTLDTGEVQPRLPGAGDVRDQNVATPEFEAPFSLTSEVAKPGKSRAREVGPSEEYLAAKSSDDAAQRAFREATRKYRAQEISDADYLDARKAAEVSAARFDEAFAKEEGRQQRSGRQTLFQSVPQTETPAFKNWFGESKVVDADGNPLVVYHGTARGDRVGNEFRKSRATSGPMAFFTSERAIAEKYSLQKQDTSFAPPEDYAGWFKMKPKGSRREVDLRQAWYYLTPDEQRKVIERLPEVGYENPDTGEGNIVAGTESIASKDHVDYLLTREAKGNGLVAAMELWLASGSLFDQEHKFLDVLKGLGLGDRFRLDDPNAMQPKVYATYLSIKNPFDTGSVPPDVLADLEVAAKRQRKPTQEVGADFWDKALRDPNDWLKQLKEDHEKGVNSFVWSSIPDWVTRVLKEHGYDGIKDAGGKMGGDEHAVWIPFEPTQIKSSDANAGTFDPNSRNILKQDRRGSIEIGPDRQIRINLFERADLSTVLHETGHFFLEVFGDLSDQVIKLDPAALTDSQRQLIADYGATLKALGVENRGELTTEQHERFARMFETYLFEGKAPSLELRSTFARFRAWMLGIYRELRNLNAPLTDEVRGVFDRMLASDRAINDAEAAGKFEPLFTDAAGAGMSPEEFGLYRAHVEDASRRAREELDVKLLSEVRRTQEADYQAKRTAVRGDVERELQGQNVYQALAGIRRGTQPDGSPLVEGLETPPLKLSRQMLVDRYGEDFVRTLPKPFVYTREGGLDPDFVADRYGFSSGDEMVKAIAAAPALKDAIERETQRRMLAQYGSLLLDGKLPEEAQLAAANDHRDAMIRAELRALWSLQKTVKPFVKAAVDQATKERDYERRWFEAESKLRVAIAAGKKQVEIDQLEQHVSELKAQARGGAARIRQAIPPATVLRDMARERIAGTRIADLDPALHWSASRRAAQSAIDAAARQEFDNAITAKTSELVNVALFREAERAKADVDARIVKVRELSKGPARARIGKAGDAYLDQVDGVLDRYDFAKVSPAALERRASIQKFVEGLESQGLPVDLPDEVLNDARRVHYSRLTYSELVGVSDGLKQLEHLARLKNRLLKIGEKRELQATADALKLSIADHATNEPNTSIEVRGPGTSTSRSIAQFFASHRKVSSIIRQMDGFKDGGEMWEHIMRPLNEAADDEAVRNEKATVALQEIFHDAYAGEETQLYRKTFVPAINTSLTKMARLMVALNWGNEGNRDRVRLGYKWSDDQVNAILGTLDARDGKFVQAIWDHLESYWPDIEAKERRVSGVAPEKVPAAPVTIAGEQLRGGYFPIKYENQLSARAAANLEASFADGIKQAAYAKATTDRGHTKARVARVSEPVRLDFGVITDHVQQVIHDLTHHETLIDVGRLLAQRDVAATIYAHYGDVVYDQLKGAVRDIAFGNQPAPGWYKTLNAIRAKTVTATLGWNAVVSLMHSLQITRGMVRVGPGWVAKGLVRWGVSARNAENSVGWIEEQSDMMRLRWKTQQRELNEVRNQVGFDRGKVSAVVHDTLAKVGVDPSAMPEIADSYFYAIRRIVQFAEIPTWIGAYEKAMSDEANDHARSIALADQAVIDSMGSGHVKDLAAVQRAPMSRLLTTFYDYHNSVYNQAYELVKSSESPGRKLMDATMLLIVPVALGAALHHVAAGPAQQKREDKSGLGRTAAAEGVDYALGMFVGLRELSGAFTGRSYEGPAGLAFVPTARRFLYRIGQEGSQGGRQTRSEKTVALAKAANEFAGALFGYPARQVQRTAGGLQELYEGKTHDLSAVFFGPRETK